MLKNLRFAIWITAIGLIAAIGLTSACGPVEYMGQVGIKTSKEFAAANEVKAEKHAPYEYWSARCYLERAREKAGYGDYQEAVRYGGKSEKMSREAQKLIKAGQLYENPNEPETEDKAGSGEGAGASGKKPVVVLDGASPGEDK
jgi:hypothetical protein